MTAERRDLQSMLANEVARVADLRAALDAGNVDLDANEWLDAIEGETDFQEAIEQIALAVLETQGQIVGIKHQEERLAARRKRLADLETTLKGIAHAAMDRATVKNIKRPAVTVSVKAVPKAIAAGLDEAEIPSEYFEPQPPKLNRKKLLEDLKDGKEIPGARLNNGGSTIQMRFS
jgi:hypothetical protein